MDFACWSWSIVLLCSSIFHLLVWFCSLRNLCYLYLWVQQSIFRMQHDTTMPWSHCNWRRQTLLVPSSGGWKKALALAGSECQHVLTISVSRRPMIWNWFKNGLFIFISDSIFVGSFFDQFWIHVSSNLGTIPPSDGGRRSFYREPYASSQGREMGMGNAWADKPLCVPTSSFGLKFLMSPIMITGCLALAFVLVTTEMNWESKFKMMIGYIQ